MIEPLKLFYLVEGKTTCSGHDHVNPTVISLKTRAIKYGVSDDSRTGLLREYRQILNFAANAGEMHDIEVIAKFRAPESLVDEFEIFVESCLFAGDIRSSIHKEEWLLPLPETFGKFKELAKLIEKNISQFESCERAYEQLMDGQDSLAALSCQMFQKLLDDIKNKIRPEIVTASIVMTQPKNLLENLDDFVLATNGIKYFLLHKDIHKDHLNNGNYKAGFGTTIENGKFQFHDSFKNRRLYTQNTVSLDKIVGHFEGKILKFGAARNESVETLQQPTVNELN